MNRTMFTLSLLMVFASCSKIQKAEKNMQSMNDTTNAMSKDMEQMKATTTTMYQQVRSKEAEDTRNKKFEILNSKDAGFGSKIAAAAVYYQSFEFQLWTNQPGFDDKNARNSLFLDAANEFTRRIADIYGKINVKKISPSKEGKSQSDAHAFYALAVSMHMNHHYQHGLVKAAKGKKIEELSFYDLVKNALRKEEYGEALEEYEQVLVTGINKEIMIELLKARVDMLSALALKSITDKRDMTIGQKAKGLLFKITGGWLGGIDLPETYTEVNDATKDAVIQYLDGAIKTKSVLADLGVEKKLEKTIRSALSKIDMSDRDEPAENEGHSPEQEDEHDARKEKTQELITTLLE